MSPAKSKYWKQTGPAQAKLLELVNDGTIDLSDTISQDELKDIYGRHEEFQEFTLERFISKVVEMKKKVDESTTILHCEYGTVVSYLQCQCLTLPRSVNFTVKQVGAKSSGGKRKASHDANDQKMSRPKEGGGSGEVVYSPKTESLPMYLPSLLYRWSDGAKEKRCGLFLQLLAGTTSSMYKAKVIEHGNVIAITYSMPSEYACPEYILSPNNHAEEVYDERTARWIGVVNEIKSAPTKKDDSITYQMLIQLPFRCSTAMLMPEGRKSYIFDDDTIVTIKKSKRFVETMQSSKTMNLELVEYIEENSDDSGMESSEDIGAGVENWMADQLGGPKKKKACSNNRKAWSDKKARQAGDNRPDPTNDGL